MNDKVYALLNRLFDAIAQVISCVQTVLLKRALCTDKNRDPASKDPAESVDLVDMTEDVAAGETEDASRNGHHGTR